MNLVGLLLVWLYEDIFLLSSFFFCLCGKWGENGAGIRWNKDVFALCSLQILFKHHLANCEDGDFFLVCLLQFDFDSAAPPEQAWRRKLDSHAGILKEFSITFMEAIKMVTTILFKEYIYSRFMS